MDGMDAKNVGNLEPLVARIYSDAQHSLRSGKQRTLIVSPPATGKTTAGLRIALEHLSRANDSDGNLRNRKVLYIGANTISVQNNCGTLAAKAPNGFGEWDFARDSVRTPIVGVTWRQLVHHELNPNIFSLVIADEAHMGMSPNNLPFMSSLRAPIVGFTNSVNHYEDTLEQLRKDSDVVIKPAEQKIIDFYGEPTTLITYAQLEESGVSLSVPVRTIAHPASIGSPDDPRIQAIVETYLDLSKRQKQNKVLIRAESIEQAEQMRKHLANALSKASDHRVGSGEILTYHSSLEPARRERAFERFVSGQSSILIHCSSFDEGHAFDDLAMIVIASRIRTPHGYERVVGRLFHSDAKEKVVIDLLANPANFMNRSGHSGKGNYDDELDVVDDFDPTIRIDATETNLVFGTSELDGHAINPDSKRLSPLWTKDTAAQSIRDLHTHGIGNDKIIPTRLQIDEGAQRGLCPPTWILFSEHGRDGFFANGEDLAAHIGRLANQYTRANISKAQVVKAIRKEWEKDPPEDGLFSKQWLAPKCDGVTLPFRLRTIVGSDTLFCDFTELSTALGFKGRYFRKVTQDQAIERISQLYKQINGKPPIARPNRPLTIAMIAQGSKERICPSPSSLFDSAKSNVPTFPGGIDEVNRKLGFRVFADMSKQEVLDEVLATDQSIWVDRRFPISQVEINTAYKNGDLPFSTRHIIGEGKMFETKADFDQAIGYDKSPFHYRSMRQQIRFGKLEPAER